MHHPAYSLETLFKHQLKPSYVSIFTRNRTGLFQDPECCELLLNIMTYNKYALNYLMLGFVIMPDHLHAILFPCKVPLGQIILKNTANYGRYHQILTGSKEPVWEKDYYSYSIKDYPSLIKIRNHIHYNPVRNHLVQNPQHYRYSSFNFYQGDSSAHPLLLDCCEGER